MLNQIGGWGMGLIVPLISAAIAYSIADRPGFAPGLIVGFLCGQIHTGFIGGMLGGFSVGYTILLLKRYIRLPQSMQGLMPIMVLPVLSTIIGGLLMMTLIGKPIALVTRSTDSFARVDAGWIALPDGGPYLARWQPSISVVRSTKPCRCFPMACWSVASTDQKP